LKRTVSGMILLLITMTSTGVVVPLVASSVPWWNKYWRFRKPITLVEQSGSTLVDFQVKIEVPYDADMRADFSDLRFVDSSGNNLSYWLERYSFSSLAVVWVKVPQIPALDTETIYMYYGNSTASSESNGDAVFDFFDDFLGTELDTEKWTWQTAWSEYDTTELQNGTGYVEVTNSIVSVVAPKNNQFFPWETQITQLASLSDFTLPLILEGNLSIPNWGGYGSAGWYRAAWSGLSDSNITPPGPHNLYWRFGAGFVLASEGNYCPYVQNESVWNYASNYPDTPVYFHTYRVLWKTNSAKFYRDGIYHGELTTNVPNKSLPVWFMASNWAGTRDYPDSKIDIEWVRVRKYAFLEPTYSIGPEEIIPEFPLTMILPLFIALTLIITLISKKKFKKMHQSNTTKMIHKDKL